jgi:hypothetical protein
MAQHEDDKDHKGHQVDYSENKTGLVIFVAFVTFVLSRRPVREHN